MTEKTAIALAAHIHEAYPLAFVSVDKALDGTYQLLFRLPTAGQDWWQYHSFVVKSADEWLERKRDLPTPVGMYARGRS